MLDYGKPPEGNEVEISVFGPGYGEAVVIHLGGGQWILVDSCLDPVNQSPASLSYLDSIGVDHTAVKAIVASHWHDDHIRGIAALANAYPSAEFHLSSVFNHTEAAAVLAAYSGQTPRYLNHGAKELYAALTARGKGYHFDQIRSVILELTNASPRIRVTALSPVPAALAKSLANFAQYVPNKTGGQPIRNIVPLRPNFESVALHIDLGDDAILLGADLEEHATYGWQAVVADRWVSTQRKASAIKVAHHGSSTADSRAMWTVLLQDAPIAALTPFNRGSVRLPTYDDVARLKGRVSRLWITSGAARKPQMPRTQLNRLRDIARNVAPINNGFGCVRLRRRRGSGWRTECFGDARLL